MRVLFYVEPHPIRDSYVQFRSVAKQFAHLLDWSVSVDARMFLNNKTLEAISGDLTAAQKERILHSTPEEEAVFGEFLVDWNSEGIPLWLDLMGGEGRVAERYEAVLRRIYHYFPFDVIVHWGENGAVTRFLREHPVKRVAMELGCTRPPFFNSVVMDLYGTNGSALVSKLTVDELKAVVDHQTMSCDEAFSVFSDRLSPKAYESWFSPLGRGLSHRLLKLEKYAFLPLQLHDDANLLRFSSYDTVADVVLDVVPKLVANGYTVVVKPHPASKQRQNSVLYNDTARSALSPWADKVVWCDEQDSSYNNIQLIHLAELVVTVNSSVGFEALYFDKPVVVLGDAVYKPEGLFPTLDQYLSGDFDRAAYLENIGYLRKFFLGGYLLPANITQDASRFFNLLFNLDGIDSGGGVSPGDVAAGLYKTLSGATQTLARRIMFGGLTKPMSGEYGAPRLLSDATSAEKAALRPYVSIAQRLMLVSGIFDGKDFAEWVSDQFLSDDLFAALVKQGEVVDSSYYLESYVDVAAIDMDPFEHYVLYGAEEGRSPRTGLVLKSRDELKERLQEVALQLMPPSLTEQEKEIRLLDLQSIKADLSSRAAEVCVVAHLYYRDVVPDLLAALQNIREPFDLLVTLPSWGGGRIRELVLESFPNALFCRVPNRGRDVGAFVDLLPTLIDKKYKAVLKLHTKKSCYQGGRLIPELGALWRSIALNSLLGSPERVGSILEAFSKNDDIAMIGSASLASSLYANSDYSDDALVEKLVSSGNLSLEGVFFEGAMCWVQPEALRPLIDVLEMDISRFCPEIGGYDRGLNALIERLLGAVAGVSGRVLAVDDDLSNSGVLSDAVPNAMPIAFVLDERLKRMRDERKEDAKGALAW